MELGLSLGGVTFSITKGNSTSKISHSGVDGNGRAVGSPPISAASYFDASNKRSLSGEEGDEIGQKDYQKKLRLSKEQSAFLEESYKGHNTPSPKQKIALARKLDLRPRQVEVWFQNRRARTKLKQTEVDCEYLKRRFEILTEEKRRLEKELQELRSLSSSSPLFCLQSPATTLTMCPSCAATCDIKHSKAAANFPQVVKSRHFHSLTIVADHGASSSQ